MGFRLHHSISEIISQIKYAQYTCSDLRTDSYTSWGIKQDLYQIKWIIDEAIRKCPVFSPEEEWLREQEKNRVIKILKEK